MKITPAVINPQDKKINHSTKCDCWAVISHGGLAEIAAGRAGGAAAPAPCLLANSTTNVFAVNSLTGAPTLAGAHGVADFMFDLGRAFPVDVSIVKAGTPSAVLQAQTITYTLDVANAGRGVAASVTVTDPFQLQLLARCHGHAPPFRLAQPRWSPPPARQPAARAATITNNVTPAALLTINKTNGVDTVAAGSITAYTVTVANQGPANAPDSVFLDPAATGLNCTSVTFSATPLASITVSPSPLTLLALQSTGITLTQFPANSTATFAVTCGIAATGK